MQIIAIILYYYIYFIIYRGKTKASRSKGRWRTKAKDAADLFARSSPLFCSVCCSHRPHHRQPLTGSHHQQRRGKSGHPARLWVDAIATTSPPIDQQPAGQRIVLSVILPAYPLFCSVCCPHRPHHRQPLIRSHHKQRRGKSWHPDRLWVDVIATTSPPIDQQPEGQRLVLSVILPASPLFCSVCCPHRPHHRQLLIGSHHQQRRGKSGHHARLWVDAIATTSPPIDQQPEGQRLVLSVILPASSSSPSSSPSSGGEGRAESQPGRAIPSRSSCRPLHPAGVCGRIYRKV